MFDGLRARVRQWRQQIAHFLGTDLPPRDLELRFDLLQPRRGATRPALTKAAIERTLSPLRENPHAYFPALLQQVRELNRYPLSPVKRLQLSSRLLLRFYRDAIRALRPMLREPRGLPEADETRTLIEILAETARTFVVSYQLVFASDYGASPFWYARVRTRAYLCAFRILELARFEQRVRALRYEPLPERTWQVANTVFRAMWGCENVEFELRILDSDLREGKLAASRSLRDLYVSMQIFWLFDPCAWPNDQQTFVDSYSDLIPGGVTLAADPGGALGSDCLVAHCYQAGPPSRARAGAGLGPALVSDYRGLALSVHGDYAELLKDRGARNRFLIPRPLRPLEPVYQVAIARLMLRALDRRGEWDNLTAGDAQERDLRIYTGFGEVYAHLQALFSEDDKVKETRRLSDIFAERSAIFGDDHTAAEESRWYVLYADERRMRIRTQETRFTNAMVIGSLLAFGFGAGEILRPRLARVVRIQRPQAGTVVIDIDRVVRFGRPVAVSKVPQTAKTGPTAPQGSEGSGAGDGQGQAAKRQWVAAILGHQPQLGWGLIVPQGGGYWEKNHIDVLIGQRGFRCHLGELAEATPEFLLFALPDIPADLIQPRYPAAATTQTE
jgi:hypothetical protein